MNKLIKTLATAAFMVAFCMTAQAQQPQQPPQPDNRQRISREELAEKQANYIADQLAFDDATTTRFVETYGNYQKEIWALGPRQPECGPQKHDNQTDEQTGQELKNRFEQSQKILNIRQKYYAEYSKFLTQKQIERVYELEGQMMKKLSNRHRPDRNQPGKDRRPEKRNGCEQQ